MKRGFCCLAHRNGCIFGRGGCQTQICTDGFVIDAGGAAVFNGHRGDVGLTGQNLGGHKTGLIAQIIIAHTQGCCGAAVADALIAAQNAVVAAQSLGIGSCYIGDITENYEYHRELLNLPQYVAPAAMLCFGYPTRQQMERTKPVRFSLEDMVHENGYDEEKSAAMPRMLAGQTGREDQELADWVRRFCKRKWNSEFSREMSRSCTAMVQHWCEKE